MGCAASTPSPRVPTVTSPDGLTVRQIKMSESGILDLSELELKELPPAVDELGAPTQQVRVELLRRYAAENPMGDEARREQGYTSPNAWLWRDHSNGRVPEPA